MKRLFLIIFLLPLLFCKAGNSPLDLDKMKKDTLTVYYHEIWTHYESNKFQGITMRGISAKNNLNVRNGQSLKRFINKFYDRCYFIEDIGFGCSEIYFRLTEEERIKENLTFSEYGFFYNDDIINIGAEKDFKLKNDVSVKMFTVKIEGVFLETDIYNVATCSDEIPLEDIPNMKEKCYIVIP